MRKHGFSLIELLVVVVISGILGGIGTVGYLAYISQARDATTKDNFEFLKRTLDNDIISVSNDLGARSKFSEGLNRQSRCFELRDRYIIEMNLERSNPFDPTKGQVCDGNHFMSHTRETDNTSTTVSIKRGQTMVYCSGTDVRAASWKTVSNKLGLKFCTCTELEECVTTHRYAGVLGDNETATGGFVEIRVVSPNLPFSTISPRVRNFLIGDEVVSVDAATALDMGSHHQFDVRLETDQSANTPVFEINPQTCFTPPGDTSKTDYMTDFSTFSGSLPARHRCYE